jgi:ribose transport system substrate-binding protein
METMKTSLRTLTTRAALVVVIALAGCSHSSSPSASTPAVAPSGGAGALQIALIIPKGTSHEHWNSIHAGANKAQQELATQGTQVNILWKETESEGDRNGQVNIVETFVAQHVSGIVLAPLGNQALTGPVHDAVSRNIPVVIIASALNSSDYSSFVATNNEKGGELAGDRMGKLLNGKGKVVVLPYALGSASTEARETGFMTAIKKYPGITVLSSNQYGGPTSDTAYKTSQNLIARYGSQVNGVFASNESNTRGMRLALRDANLLHKVVFVGFDAAPDLIQALRADEIQALVAQDPFKIGYTGVMTLVRVIHGKQVPKEIDAGVSLLTKQTVGYPINQEVVNPPLAQYLK